MAVDNNLEQLIFLVLFLEIFTAILVLLMLCPVPRCRVLKLNLWSVFLIFHLFIIN